MMGLSSLALWFLFMTGAGPAAGLHFRVGLFTLFQPQAMLVRADDHALIVLETNGRTETLHLAPQMTLRVKRVGDRLRVTLMNPTHRKISTQVASLIRCEPALTGHEPAWRVTIDNGRLIRTLAGSLRIDAADGAIRTIVHTDPESLVARVAASEMSGASELESLKALAVVARTFIHATRSRHSRQGFDFCDTTHCQWYQGEDRLLRDDRFSRLVRRAVRETENLVLNDNGRVLPVYFTGSCGGRTAPPELIWGQSSSDGPPVERSVPCHWCQGSRFYRWERHIRKEMFLRVIEELTGTSSHHARLLPQLTEQGFVKALCVESGDERRCISEEDLRSKVGRVFGWNLILSNAYTIEDRGYGLVFRGRGFGHNVGLCLSGAVAQAKGGREYDDILKYYFPHTGLSPLPVTAPVTSIASTVEALNATDVLVHRLKKDDARRY